jgi:hypothetical protein
MLKFNLYHQDDCPILFLTAMDTVHKIHQVFPQPFPQFGTFLSYFNQEFSGNFDFQTPNFEENFHLFFANLLFDLYDGHETNNVSLYNFFNWGSFDQKSFFENK